MIKCFVFFFKQKTAYEMRISDWSSDVCSSVYVGDGKPAQRRRAVHAGDGGQEGHDHGERAAEHGDQHRDARAFQQPRQELAKAREAGDGKAGRETKYDADDDDAPGLHGVSPFQGLVRRGACSETPPQGSWWGSSARGSFLVPSRFVLP